jgi:uncharacterized protein YkwD
MKFLPIAITLLTRCFLTAAARSPSPATPETATSLNGFRAAHGLSELRTDGALAALASEHSPTWRGARASTTTAS